MIEELWALTYWRPWPTAILKHGKDCENRPNPPPRALFGKRACLHSGKTYGVSSWPFPGQVPTDEECPLGLVGSTIVAGALEHVGTSGRRRLFMTDVKGLIEITANSPDDLKKHIDLCLKEPKALELAHAIANIDRSQWWAGPVGIYMTEPRALATPIAINGKQGWWRVPPAIAAEYRAQEQL